MMAIDGYPAIQLAAPGLSLAPEEVFTGPWSEV